MAPTRKVIQMDLKQYLENESELERERSEDVVRLVRLIRLISNKKKNVIDIGARGGYFSIMLTEFYENVTALDLEKPSILHKNINCVQGNITNLNFSNNFFDFVFCAEVLEHIPSRLLQKACSELSRISKEYLLIGVPYKQDTRISRTTCYSCGEKNPPWGHVNSFNRKKLQSLFPHFKITETSFVGETNSHTNFMSTFFMDLAGNPYGTYEQKEVCINCEMKLKHPPERSLLQKIFTKVAFYMQDVQKPFYKAHPKWIHLVFKRITA